MKQLRYWSFLPAFCLLALPLMGQNSLELGSDTVKVGENANVSLTLNSDSEVQGLVAAFEWDGAKGSGVDFLMSALVMSADTRVKRVEADYMVLGVVMDNDGTAGQVIPAGSSDLGTAVINTLAIGDLNLQFVDGKYATVDGGPLLDNIIVVGGLSIGAGDGLGLGGDALITVVDCLPRLTVAGSNEGNNTASATVVLENCVDVEGFVVALCHDGGDLQLTSIDPGSASADAEFIATEVDPGAGGWIAVIYDVVEPFAGQTLAPGVHDVAVYNYNVLNSPAPGESPFLSPLAFCNGVLGDPAKDNVFVAGGQSFDIDDRDDGAVEILPIIQDNVERICDDGIDNDGDGATDLEDSDCQQAFACGVMQPDGTITDVTGQQGDIVEVCFFVRSPEDNNPGVPEQPDHIQGLSMVLSFDCQMQAVSDLDISGTILEAIGAEFVATQRDNDPNDGDGCELVIAVLVDAQPPFDGATIPPLPDFQSIGCIDFAISENAKCDSSLALAFEDGLNGTTKVPNKNIISAENQARSPQTTNCNVNVVGNAVFFRGDCNFSGEEMGMAINIADAASVVSYLFPNFWVMFEPPCDDACDCNDDGRLDLADAFCILNYLFKGGSFPPAPGSGLNMDGTFSKPGPDPTPDHLDCEGGTACIR